MLRIMKLEERIVLDATGFSADDSDSDTTTDSQFAADIALAVAADNTDADSSEHDGDIAYTDTQENDNSPDSASDLVVDEGAQSDATAEEVKVLVVADGADDDGLLKDAAADGVVVVAYDSDTESLSDLLEKIEDSLDGQQADSIGFAVHDAGEGKINLAENEIVSIVSLLYSDSQQSFWKSVGGMVKEGGRIDIMSCYLTSTESGQLLVGEIEHLSERNVAASDDPTGNESAGGDWVLESDNVDISSVYFNSQRLAEFDDTLTAPAIADLSGTLNYSIGASETIIDADASISDAEGDFDTGTLTVQFTSGGTTNDRLTLQSMGFISVTGGNVKYNSTTIGTVSGGTDGSTPLVITWNGSATATSITAALQLISYSNVSGAPNTADRTVSFTMVDAAAETSNVATVTIDINEKTTLDLDGDNSSGATGNDYAATFKEDNGAIAIVDTGDMALADGDNTNLASATITLTNLLDAGAETLAANTTGTTITASYNSTTGVLTLTGSDTVAHYEQVLKSITYENTSNTPNTTARTITVVVNDGVEDSATATSTITVEATNDKPTLDLDMDDSGGTGGNDYAETYNENAAAVVLTDTDVIITDGESANMEGATVTLTNLLDTGMETLAATTGGTSISASYNSTTGVLTLSGTDTLSNYMTVLRTVSYQNTSEDPNTTARTIQFKVTDGTDYSDVATCTVTVQASNDKPTLDLDGDNSTTAGLNYAGTFIEDSGAVGIVDSDATLSDLDHTNLTSASVSLSNIQDAGLETLAADTTGTSISASYNSSTGLLTLTGSDTIAHYLQVLKSITYNNTSNTPTTAITRAINITVSDGTDSSVVAISNITVQANNDAPALDLDGSVGGTGYSTTFAEGGGAVVVVDAGDMTLSDVDSTNLSNATITLTNHPDGTAESLSATVGATGITASYDSGTGVLTLSGSSSVANYLQVLKTVSYNNTSDNPNTTARTITIKVNDGAADSNVATSTVSVTAVNDAPALDLDGSVGGTGYSATFTEDGGAVSVVDASDMTLVDPDTTNLVGATITLTNHPDGAAEALAATVGSTGISASYDSGTGVLTLSNSSSVANYLQVLKTVTYNNTSDTPDTTARTITIKVNDGSLDSNVATSTIAVVAANDAPALDLDGSVGGTGYSAAFTEGGSAVAIVDAGDMTLSDPDTTNLAGATITITNLQNGAAELLAVNVGTTNITIASNAGGVLTLTGNDTVANYLQVLKTLTYQNTSNAPGTTARAIEIKVTDGTDYSPVATSTVTVNAVNDAPVLDLDGDNSSGATGANYSTTFTENAAAVAVVDSDMTLTDIDDVNLEGATVTITNLKDGASEVLSATVGATGISSSYNSTTGVLTLSGSSSVANYLQVLKTVTYENTNDTPDVTARTITVKVNDGDVDSNVATATVAVVATNDAPAISTSGTVAFNEGSSTPVILDGSATISDAEQNYNGGSGTLKAQVTGNYATGDLLTIVSGGNNVTTSGSNVLYNSSVVGTFSGGTSGTALTITWSAAVDNATVQAVLRQIAYRNTEADATPANDRTVTFTITDSDGLAASDTVTVDVNDAPAIGGISGSIAYTENASATLLNGSATVADTEGAYNTGTLVVDITSGNTANDKLTIINGGASNVYIDGANVKVGGSGGTIVGTYTGGTGTTALQITWNASADNAAVQAVLNQIAYSNSSDNPSTTARTVRFTLSDAAGAASNQPTATVNITAVNDAPSLGGVNGDSVTFTENSGGVAVDSGGNATLSDAEQNYSGGKLTAEITANGTANDRLLIAAGNGVTISGANVLYSSTVIGTFTGGTNGSTPLVITWNAAATDAAVQAVTRQITFNNVSENPNTTARTVGLTATDGSAASSGQSTVTVNMTAVNDAAIISNLSGTVSYTENTASPTVIDADATVVDPEQNYNSGTMTVSITANGTANDRLTIVEGGTGGGVSDVHRDGNNVYVNWDGSAGTLVGTCTGGTNGSTPLVVTWNGSATDAYVQAVMRHIAYSNTSENPDTTARTVTFTMKDASAATSNEPTVTVNVVAVNDAPTVTVPGATVNVNEQTDVTVGGISIADIDTGSSTTTQVTVSTLQGDITLSGTTGLTFVAGSNGSSSMVISGTLANINSALNNLTYKNMSDNPLANDTITVSVNDKGNTGGGDKIASDTITVAITPVNDAPTVDLDASAGGVNYSTGFTENEAAVAIGDVDLSVTDADSATLQGATVRLTNQQAAGSETPGGEILAADTSGTSITVTYDASSGLMTLAGADSVANYQKVLRSITYENKYDQPTTANRTVEVKVSDGSLESAVATATISVQKVNDAPITTLNGTLTFTEGDSAKSLDETLTLVDPDDTVITQAVVEFTDNYVKGEDYLLFTDTSTITATFDSDLGKLVLSGNDTVANYQEALRAVKYQNASNNPNTAVRKVDISVTDSNATSAGNGVQVGTVTQEIYVNEAAGDQAQELESAPPPDPTAADAGADAAGESGQSASAESAANAGATAIAEAGQAVTQEAAGEGESYGESSSSSDGDDIQIIQDIADVAGDTTLAVLKQAAEVLGESETITKTVLADTAVSENAAVAPIIQEFTSLQAVVSEARADIQTSFEQVQDITGEVDVILRDVISSKESVLKDAIGNLEVVNQLLVRASEILKENPGISLQELEELLRQERVKIQQEVARKSGGVGQIMKDAASAYLQERQAQAANGKAEAATQKGGKSK